MCLNAWLINYHTQSRHCRKEKDELPTAVAVAYKILEENKKRKKQRHKHVVDGLGLSRSSFQSRLEGVPVRWVHRCSTSYPPLDKDIYETDEIKAIWEEHCKNKKHPDPRGKFKGSWPEMERLDESQLQLTIGLDESMIVKDIDTKQIVIIVLRNFMRDEEVLSWTNGVVDENIGIRRGIRVCTLTKISYLIINLAPIAGRSRCTSPNWIYCWLQESGTY